jgi:hypothetical protein
MRRLERRHDLFTGDGRKGVEKFFDAVASFQVVDKVSERDARAFEHRCTAEDIWVAVNYGHWRLGFIVASGRQTCLDAVRCEESLGGVTRAAEFAQRRRLQ